MLYLLLSSFFVIVASFDFDWDHDMMTQHTNYKLLNECLGKSFVDSWKDSVMASSIKCFSENSLGETPDLPSILKDAFYQNNILTNAGGPKVQPPPDELNFHNLLPEATYPQPPLSFQPYHPLVPHYTPQVLPPYNPSVLAFQRPLLTHLMRRFPNMNFVAATVPNQRVWKRDVAETSKSISSGRSSKILQLRPEWRTGEANDIGKLLNPAHPLDPIKKQIGDRISNITCVLKSMEVLDEFGLPNYERNLELFNHLSVSDHLRDGLKGAHEFCKEFSLCVPTNRVSNLLVKEIGQSLIFLKCLKKKVMNACVREDMRKNGYMNSFTSSVFDMTALEGGFTPGAKSLFADTPDDVVKNLEDFFASDDELVFGY